MFFECPKTWFGTCLLSLQLLKKTYKSCGILIILICRKYCFLSRVCKSPKFTKIEKGLPVKDVEQKLMIFVFFRVAQKGPYCFPSRTESKNHRFGRFWRPVFGAPEWRSAAAAAPPRSRLSLSTCRLSRIYLIKYFLLIDSSTLWKHGSLETELCS